VGMERKRIRQTGNRSWGRKLLTVYANDDIPDVTFCGSVNKVFDTLASITVIVVSYDHSVGPKN